MFGKHGMDAANHLEISARRTLRLRWEEGQGVPRFTADEGEVFQVEFSDDLQVWEPFGASIEGDDLERAIRLERPDSQGYLRLSIE